jgi:SAM-dependent methyltransferase
MSLQSPPAPPAPRTPSAVREADKPRMDSHLYELLHSIPDTYWRYVTRHRLLLNLWRDYRQPQSDYRVLDVGCGPGGLLAYLAQRQPMHAFGVDLFFDALHYSRQRGIRCVAAADATALPFPSAAFDLVVSQDVLEHVEDDAAMLSEIYRMARPGGLAMIVVPAFQSLWSTRDVRLHHFRRYRLPRLAAAIESAGFTVLRRTYTDAFLVAPMWAAVKLAPRDSNGVPQINVEAPGGGGLANSALKLISGFEALLARRFRIPFGASALVLARKP